MWHTIPKREQSRPEETANAASHGIALLAVLIGAPFLAIRAVRYGDPGFVVGTSIFSATAITLYLSSTLYHILPTGKSKGILQLVEHSAIYLLIAGTYTPFTLGILRGAWGWAIFGAIWGLAVTGVLLTLFGKNPHPILTTGLYLLMGWLILVAVQPLSARMPPAGLHWLLAGGLSYTAGVAFFATDSRLQYGHLIWHLFVIAGTTCHYFAVLWYAL